MAVMTDFSPSHDEITDRGESEPISDLMALREADETVCVDGEERCPGPEAADDEDAPLPCWECFRRGWSR